MKNKLVFILGVLLAFSLAFTACDTGSSGGSGGNSNGKMLTYLMTIDNTLSNKNPKSVTLAKNGASLAAAEDDDGWVTLDELYASEGLKIDIFQLNGDPKPEWLLTPSTKIKVRGIPTDEQYIFTVQVEGNGKEPEEDRKTAREKEFWSCYVMEGPQSGHYTHIEGKDWYFTIYDQVNHTAYGDHTTMFIEPDIDSATADSVTIFPYP
jgi:hypothetical protein